MEDWKTKTKLFDRFKPPAVIIKKSTSYTKKHSLDMLLGKCQSSKEYKKISNRLHSTTLKGRLKAGESSRYNNSHYHSKTYFPNIKRKPYQHYNRSLLLSK